MKNSLENWTRFQLSYRNDMNTVKIWKILGLSWEVGPRKIGRVTWAMSAELQLWQTALWQIKILYINMLILSKMRSSIQFTAECSYQTHWGLSKPLPPCYPHTQVSSALPAVWLTQGCNIWWFTCTVVTAVINVMEVQQHWAACFYCRLCMSLDIAVMIAHNAVNLVEFEQFSVW